MFEIKGFKNNKDDIKCNNENMEEELFRHIQNYNKPDYLNDIKIRNLGFTPDDLRSEIYMRILKYYPDYSEKKQYWNRIINQQYISIIKEENKKLKNIGIYQMTNENDSEKDNEKNDLKYFYESDNKIIEENNFKIIKDNLIKYNLVDENNIDEIIDIIINNKRRIPKRLSKFNFKKIKKVLKVLLKD